MTTSPKILEGWPLSEARTKLSEVVRLAQKEPQTILVNGEAQGALIGTEDLQLLLALKRQRSRAAIEKFIAITEEEGVFSEDFGELRGKTKEILLKD